MPVAQAKDQDVEDPTLPTGADVEAASKRIGKNLVRTQTRRSPRLAALTGAKDVFLKIDTELHTASFKERGALNALLCMTPKQKKAGVITASAGNHAQALAYHAKRLGISPVVVMPKPTPQVKIDGARALGAKVVLHGELFDDALEEASRIGEDEGRTFVHAFDDANVIAGQGVALKEMLEDAPDLDVVAVPVGGGGLIAGCLLAREGRGDGRKPIVIAVEPTMYPSMARAVTGEAPVLLGGDTIAEGVAVKTAGGLTAAIVKQHISAQDMVDVSESSIEEAIVKFAMVEKLVVEGAGALGLAAMLENPDFFRDRSVGLMVCGGNIDARLFGQVLARHLARAHRRARIRVECSDRPGRLAKIAMIMQASGANVMDVIHDRLALDAPAKGTIIDFIIETSDESVTAAVVERLQAAGFPRSRVLESR